MIKYLQEHEWALEEYVIHEKNGKLKAYYNDAPLIKRYERFINYLNSKKANVYRDPVYLLYKPRIIN